MIRCVDQLRPNRTIKNAWTKHGLGSLQHCAFCWTFGVLCQLPQKDGTQKVTGCASRGQATQEQSKQKPWQAQWTSVNHVAEKHVKCLNRLKHVPTYSNVQEHKSLPMSQSVTAGNRMAISLLFKNSAKASSPLLWIFSHRTSALISARNMRRRDNGAP